MNKRLGILIALLAALLVLTALPAALAADTPIKTAGAIDIDWPQPGKTPDYTATARDNTYTITNHNTTYYKNGIAWRDETEGKSLTPTDKFVAGHDYSVTVMFSPLSGYYFPNKSGSTTKDVNTSINFITASTLTYSDYNDRVGAKKIYPCGTAITYAAISGIDKPLPGYTPDFSGADSNSHCTLKSVKWWSTSDAKYMTSSDKFVGGNQYCVEVTLTADSGYVFKMEDELFLDPDFTAKINAADAGDAYSEDLGKTLIMQTWYDCPNFIDTATITIAAPHTGAKPTFTVTDDGEANYYGVSDVHWYPSSNVNQSGYSMGYSDTFQQNYKYTAIIHLEPQDGYTFSNNNLTTNYTVNGVSPSKVVTFTNGAAALYQEFTCTTLISSVELKNYVSPVSGETPSYAISTSTTGVSLGDPSAESGTWKNSVSWYDRNNRVYLATDGQFVAGRQYLVSVMIKPYSGYEFVPQAQFSATINGKTAHGYTRGNQMLVQYFENALTAITAADIGYLSAPLPGKTPDYDILFTSNTGVKLHVVNSGKVLHGISWYDVSADEWLETDALFVAGHNYLVVFDLEAQDGYAFPSNPLKIAGTVNGQKATNMTVSNAQYATLYYEIACVSSGWVQIGSDWYYYDTDGNPAEGWLKVSGIWYYFESGKMKTGWLEVGGKKYYLKDNGAMTTGWLKIDGSYYYFDASGVMKVGWLNLSGTYYYLDASGKMVTGWQKIGGVYYYFNASGAMLKGWQKIGGVYYYFSASGAMVTGWQKIGGVYYYFSASGAMVTGWQKIGGVYYYFDSNGKMLTGWQKIGGLWYYFDANGKMLTGWQKINEKWYYFKDNGAMVTGTYVIGGVTYVFDSNGVWQNK